MKIGNDGVAQWLIGEDLKRKWIPGGNFLPALLAAGIPDIGKQPPEFWYMIPVDTTEWYIAGGSDGVQYLCGPGSRSKIETPEDEAALVAIGYPQRGPDIIPTAAVDALPLAPSDKSGIPISVVTTTTIS